MLLGNFVSAQPGQRTVCEDLADRLEARGLSVLRASHRSGSFIRALHIAGSALSKGSMVSAAQIDVYSGRAFLWAEAAAAALGFHKTPFIVTLHGGNLPALAQAHPRRVRRLLQSAAAVTAPSPFLRNALAPIRRDIQLIPNGLDLSVYSYRRRANPSPTLLWLRAFHSIYNPSMAVRVLSKILKKYPDARLTMVGPDKGDGSLQAAQSLADTLRIGQSVEFILGVPKSQVPGTLQSADIFLNTTNIDNTPVSVLEAMASGLCVVTTDAGGIPDLVRHGKDALVTPMDDAEAMAGAVSRILTGPNLAEDLSANGRAAAEAFDWSRVLPMWESLFDRISRPL